MLDDLPVGVLGADDRDDGAIEARDSVVAVGGYGGDRRLGTRC